MHTITEELSSDRWRASYTESSMGDVRGLRHYTQTPYRTKNPLNQAGHFTAASFGTDGVYTCAVHTPPDGNIGT